MTDSTVARALRAELETAADEMIELAVELIRIPTVNPPGAEYRRCADVIGSKLGELGFEVEYVEAEGRPEHTTEHPRVNVVGTIVGDAPGPGLHVNGHYDVVPPGDGWTFDPFGGAIQDGRLCGRGSSDMKAGLVAGIFALASFRRAGVGFRGRLQVSATPDEESGGFAGVAHLVATGHIDRDGTEYVIIPEPFGLDGISLGHRGVYWSRLTARGRTGHGSMPFLGGSAIDDLTALLERLRVELVPALRERETRLPVVPAEARRPSINVNSIRGGQTETDVTEAAPLQTPCVADHAVAVLDRRFIAEERFEDVRGELVEAIETLAAEDPERAYELVDVMVVEPTFTDADAPLVRALGRAIETVAGGPPRLVASPGTYDQKHVVRVAGIEQCVAYGPGELEQAHQPDESCSIEAVVRSAQTMALATLELLGTPSSD